jgi:hypothetical protein
MIARCQQGHVTWSHNKVGHGGEDHSTILTQFYLSNINAFGSVINPNQGRFWRATYMNVFPIRLPIIYVAVALHYKNLTLQSLCLSNALRKLTD